MHHLLSLILSTFFAVLPPEEAQLQNEKTVQDVKWQTGHEWFSKIESDYNAGKFDTFLKAADEWYQKGAQNGDWKPLIDNEKGIAEKYNTPEGKKLYEELSQKVDAFNDDLKVAKEKRDLELQRIAEAYPNAPITKVILARMAVPKPSPEELKAVETLEVWASPFPLTQPISSHDIIKNIAFEYNIKEYLLNASYAQGAKKSDLVPDFGLLDKDKVEQYRIALALDKLKKMQAAAKKSGDQDAAHEIDLVIQAFPILAQEIYNGTAIELGSQNTSDEAAGKVAKVIQEYVDQKNTLLEKHGIK